MDFLYTNEVNLVISDISPIAFIAADKAGVTSVGLSNFTWYTAYLAMIEQSALLPLHEAYAMMDYFIRLEGADEPEWGRKGSLQAGFFSREKDGHEVVRIQQTINPGNKKRVVYFGIGMSINVQDLAEMKLWTNEEYLFIVSSNMRVKHKNVISIPISYTESQNYVAVSDVVISKPGWSTVGEAVALQKPLILLHRSSMKEDENTLRALRSIHPYRLVEWEQLIEGNMQNLIDREYLFADKQQRNEITQIVAYLDQIVRSG
ncbi:glycosyltransferase [Paenibacillus sp. YAF4_2]|uniref:glycosyltransferase n=1 Tax=Paenibacillus sp. YAF4_2 TaxID=3233085 RepID=UPI003F944C8A